MSGRGGGGAPAPDTTGAFRDDEFRAGRDSGCLSDQEIASLQAAVPGQAPEAVARHLASCERCQRQALFGSRRRPSWRRRALPEPPTLGRALFYSALVLGAMAAFFWTLRMLVGPGQ